jgi:DHA2 family multidrug resistance protein
MTAVSPSSQGSGEGMAPVASGPVRQGSSRPPGGVGAPAVQLTGGTLLAAGFILAFANFMVVLDMTIANVSVPNIAGGLGVSANQGTWVITSYAVAEAITVPLTGWLAQRFGSVRTFVTAMALFGLFSALCGLAPSLSVLVVFRILQGLAGGPMMPLSQTLLLRVFPKEQAGKAMGLWAMTTVVGPIAGPILGGLICDGYSWPWVFFINVPFAALFSVLAWRTLAAQETQTKKLPIDFTGLGIMIVWIAALQIMLDQGADLDWFNSPFIVGLLITAIVGFVAFVIWELTDANPVVNLRVFANRGYAVGCLVMCLCFGSYFACVVIVPLWLQTNLGYTASWAGYAVAPAGVFAVIVSPIVAKLMTKVDPRVLLFIGVSGLAGTMLMRAGFASNINFGSIVVPQFAQGLFAPLFFVPVFALSLGALKPQDIAGGAGLLSFTRTMAGAFATCIATTVWSDTARKSRVQLLNQTDTGAAVHQMTGLGLSHGQAIRQVEGLIQSQSVMLATDKLFLGIAVLMALAALSVLLIPKPKGAAAPVAAH